MQNMIFNCTDLPFLVNEYLHMIAQMEILNFGNHLILVYLLDYKMLKECTKDFLLEILLPSKIYSLWGLCLDQNRDVSVARMQFRCLDNSEHALKTQLTDSQESMKVMQYFPQQPDLASRVASLNSLLHFHISWRFVTLLGAIILEIAQNNKVVKINLSATFLFQ